MNGTAEVPEHPLLEGLLGRPFDRGRNLWKAALYWGTELPVFTVSPELRAGNGDGNGRATTPDGTRLPADAPSRWRYVGTARYGEFPPSLRSNATVLTRGRDPPRPPPDAANLPSTSTEDLPSTVSTAE